MSNKRIAVINATSYGSTGIIARRVINAYEGEARLFCFRSFNEYSNVTTLKINKLTDLASHAISRIDGKDAFHYHALTKKLIKELEAFKPDIIHIHNLHGYYINMPMLFEYIKKNQIKIYWTLHDFWVATGRCAHPDECKNYFTGCKSCPNKGCYPYTILHFEKPMFKKKKEVITSLDDLTFITPSEFIANKVRETHLNKYEVKVINNGIDLDRFYYEDNNLRETLNISKDKKVLLSVMLPISEFKGIEYLNRLAEEEKDYQIVLIGKNEDKLEINKNIIHIDFVNQEDIHKYYSMSDLFINPTLSDNYPTVDMEAISCLLPIVSFDTGGSKEIITPNVGLITPRGDYESFKEGIKKLLNTPINKEELKKRRLDFSKDKMIEEYLRLYE